MHVSCWKLTNLWTTVIFEWLYINHIVFFFRVIRKRIKISRVFRLVLIQGKLCFYERDIPQPSRSFLSKRNLCMSKAWKQASVKTKYFVHFNTFSWFSNTLLTPHSQYQNKNIKKHLMLLIILCRSDNYSSYSILLVFLKTEG